MKVERLDGISYLDGIPILIAPKAGKTRKLSPDWTVHEESNPVKKNRRKGPVPCQRRKHD